VPADPESKGGWRRPCGWSSGTWSHPGQPARDTRPTSRCRAGSRRARCLAAWSTSGHITSNADVGAVEVAWLDEQDPYVNPMGPRSTGELPARTTASTRSVRSTTPTGTRPFSRLLGHRFLLLSGFAIMILAERGFTIPSGV
jgi:hypothetical protein